MVQRNNTLVQCRMKNVATQYRGTYVRPVTSRDSAPEEIIISMKQELNMHEQIARQVREMVAAAAKAELPEQARVAAQETVAKAREVCAQWAAAVETGGKALEDVVLAGQSNAKAITTRIATNALANTNAALAAAEEIVEAKTVTEAAQIQARFLQTQATVLREQGTALVELSLKAAKEAVDTAMKAAANAAAEANRAGA
jgi:hypothetical protein